MASFSHQREPSSNPFDDLDFLSNTTAPSNTQHSLRPPPVVTMPSPVAQILSTDDYGGFFDSPTKSPVSKHNQSFSDLHSGVTDDFDDWSGFGSPNKNTSNKSPSNIRLKKRTSVLSPRVMQAAKRSSSRRTSSKRPSSAYQTNFVVSPPSRSSTKKSIGTPRSSMGRMDAKKDDAKTQVLIGILTKIMQFSRSNSTVAQNSLSLTYAELDKFVANPRYRDCNQAIDGVLEVYRTLKQLEHDIGQMDKRLIQNYENLKKLAMQLGGQQAILFSRCQVICEEIRGQPVPHDPYGASSPPRTPKKGSVLELESEYGLNASAIVSHLETLNQSSGNKCALERGQLTGYMSLRKTDGVLTKMRKWQLAFFVLNNDRLVVFKDDRDIRRTKPILDIRMHGKMQISGFKPYQTKNGVIVSCKFQELDQTLGHGKQKNEWSTMFKFGNQNKSLFELWKQAMMSVVTFHRKKDPTMALKRSFSFGVTTKR